MTEDENTIADLRERLARAEQKADDAALAVILARDVSTARWTSLIAVLISLLGFVIKVLK